MNSRKHTPESVYSVFREIDEGLYTNASFSDANVMMITKEHYAALEDAWYGDITMTSKELIQENKWMREKLVALCHELMDLSMDTGLVLDCSLKNAPNEIEAIRKHLYDMSISLSKEGFE